MADTAVDSNGSLHRSVDGLESQRPFSPGKSLVHLESSDAWKLESTTHQFEWIRYRDWSSPLADLNLHNITLLRKELGDAWTIPEDGRIPLSFSLEHFEDLNTTDIEKRLPLLAVFKNKMKRDDFVNLKIMDQYTRESHNHLDKFRRSCQDQGQVTCPPTLFPGSCSQ